MKTANQEPQENDPWNHDAFRHIDLYGNREWSKGILALFGLDVSDVTETEENPQQPDKTDYYRQIGAKLQGMSSREDVISYLAGMTYTVTELRALCEANDVTYRKSDKKDRLIDRIAEDLVGSRLRHNALLTTKL
jgi:hypothetical protein